MSSATIKRTLGAGLAVGALGATFGLGLTGSASASAAASAAEQRPAASERYCAVMFGQAVDGKSSPVIAQACDATSEAAARAKMVKAAPASAAAAKSVKLMSWYTKKNYKGDKTSVYEPYKCDTAGYRLQPNSWWSVRITSATGTKACNKARFVSRDGNQSETHKLGVKNLSWKTDNDVGKIFVYHS